MAIILLHFLMKLPLFSTILIIVLPLKAFSQLKHDYVWTLGYGERYDSPIGYDLGGFLLNFNQIPPSSTLQDYSIGEPLACISDKNGNLVAYTDGCRIMSQTHQLMVNGDTLNPGEVFEEFCDLSSYPLWQPCIFLPKPGSDSLYYLFHLRADDVLWNPVNLMYSVLDASGDNGNGAVVSKNNVVLTDSIFLGNYVTATRHGNGWDWWVVSPQRFNFNIHVSLFTADSVAYKGLQLFDAPKPDSTCCVSQTAFSPDGSKYFRNSHEGLFMLDFDRCTGLLSNPIYLDWDSLPFGGGGVAVSPNNRFLYLTSGGTVQQYDLYADDIASSLKVVAEYDGFLAPTPTNFFQMMHGPDGKIYIATSQYTTVMHIIHNPNASGIDCNVEQHGLLLPSIQGIRIPNFANYNLGPLNPPCSSGAGEPGGLSEALQVSPNPNDGTFQLSFPYGASGDWQLALFDLSGRNLPFSSAGDMIRAPQLPAGLYILTAVHRKDGTRLSARFCVGR
jgi:hypothetical protein